MPIESSDSNMWNLGIVQLLLLKNIADGVDESRFRKNALQASQSRAVDIIWLLQLVNYAANLLFVKPMARVEIAFTRIIRSIKFVDCWWGANFCKGSVLAIVSKRLQQGFIATHLLGVSVPSPDRLVFNFGIMCGECQRSCRGLGHRSSAVQMFAARVSDLPEPYVSENCKWWLWYPVPSFT